MKKQLFNLAAILLIAGFSNSLIAQETATATVEATIVTPITITKTQDMNFGNVAVQSTTGGTVILAVDGSRTATAGATLPATGAGTATQATFDITGEGVYVVSVDLPEDGDITIDDPGAGVVMAVDTFTSNGLSGTGDTTATLVAGAFTLNVGATLHVAAAQLAGVYVGSFDVIVNYN